jgi:TPR repeat protein
LESEISAAQRSYFIRKMNEAEFKSLLKRAEVNDLDAMLKVAIAFREADGTDLNADKFVEWAKKAAELGSGEAVLKLALAYRDRDGVEGIYEREPLAVM